MCHYSFVNNFGKCWPIYVVGNLVEVLLQILEEYNSDSERI